jgi:hypothetical protein
MRRRRLLGTVGAGSLTLLSAPLSRPAWAQPQVDLHAPGGPSIRPMTMAYPQKGPMILQRTSPPWLETPVEVFDKGVFTPNDQHYVSWHWATFPSEIDVGTFRLTVRGHVNQTLSLSLDDLLHGMPRGTGGGQPVHGQLSHLHAAARPGGLEGGDARARVGIAPVHRHGVGCRHPLHHREQAGVDLAQRVAVLDIRRASFALLGKADAGDADYQPGH